MRYAPSENLIRLVIALGSTRTGLTLDEIQEDLRVGRRTAERLMAAVRRFADVEETPQIDEDRRKRWRIRHMPAGLANPTGEEMAALGAAASLLRREGMDDHAERIDTLAGKLTASTDPKRAVRLETDIAALLEAEGFVSRPGPRPAIDGAVLATLRHAVLACLKVDLLYRARGDGETSRRIVHPYGFLYGARHYLVAFSEAARARDVRLYALPNVVEAHLLEETFTRVQGFSMDGYTRQMFGVFRETPSDVVWRFSAEAAEDVRAFLFHPDQRLKALPDGRVEVTFRAGGLKEMAWHLFRWGGHVEVVSPPELRAMMVEMLEESLARHHP